MEEDKGGEILQISFDKTEILGRSPTVLPTLLTSRLCVPHRDNGMRLLIDEAVGRQAL